ncbi:response regulator receiver protein [Burkholderia sp. S171]|uniref:response regulator receiver protein n=1 Tax=Burkholderia sp. S171 TaxID=1641860 RepID=UPI00131CB97F|nr:response regulator receiver protein [Burkholderia sp. S171]
MTRRPFEADQDQFALWHPKRLPTLMPARRVVIAHLDAMIGESFVLLLGLKGLAAQHVKDVDALTILIEDWHPQVLMIDTRLGTGEHGAFVRKLSDNPSHAGTLLIALSNFLPEDSIPVLQEAGYDGHCRRPCPMWRVSEVLSDFFAPNGASISR